MTFSPLSLPSETSRKMDPWMWYSRGLADPMPVSPSRTAAQSFSSAVNTVMLTRPILSWPSGRLPTRRDQDDWDSSSSRAWLALKCLQFYFRGFRASEFSTFHLSPRGCDIWSEFYKIIMVEDRPRWAAWSAREGGIFFHKSTIKLFPCDIALPLLFWSELIRDFSRFLIGWRKFNFRAEPMKNKQRFQNILCQQSQMLWLHPGTLNHR